MRVVLAEHIAHGAGRFLVLGDYPKGSHLPKVLTDESLKILDRYRNDSFLLYLAFYSVHTPLQGREDLIAKYKAKRQKLLDASEREFGPEEQVWPVKQARQVRLRQCHPVYAAMVEAMDEQIGRVLDKLDVYIVPGPAMTEVGDGIIFQKQNVVFIYNRHYKLVTESIIWTKSSLYDY